MAVVSLCVYIITINLTRHLFHSRSWVLDIASMPQCQSVYHLGHRMILPSLWDHKLWDEEVRDFVMDPNFFLKVAPSAFLSWQVAIRSHFYVSKEFNFCIICTPVFQYWKTTLFKTCLFFIEHHDICKIN